MTLVTKIKVSYTQQDIVPETDYSSYFILKRKYNTVFNDNISVNSMLNHSGTVIQETI